VCWIIPYGINENHALKNLYLKEAGLASKNIQQLLKKDAMVYLSLLYIPQKYEAGE